MTYTPIINTPCGPIQGIHDKENKMYLFKGVRFATAGRFEYPKQVTHWEDTYLAETFGPACYQESSFVEANPNDFYEKEFYNGETRTYSEDCLFLNIWAPENAENAPVLVYIHGGAFNHGYSYEKPFDGTEYCKRGIIVVTISYRLHVFGFLTLPELKDENDHVGNYALFDQMTALSWIQDNIKAFGGNPANVTLSGQSAGAMSVQLHCVSPLTEGLFQRAIMFSGGGVSEPSRHTKTLENQLELSKQYMKRLGVQTAEELKQLDAKTLTLEYLNLCKELPKGEDFCRPVIDDHFLPASEYALTEQGLQKNIPYMLGTTSEDIFPEILHPIARDWAKRQYEQKRQPAYHYYFSRQLPGDDKGAWHSADLWYVFGTLKKCWRPFTDWDYQLSAAIIDYIAAFSKTGNPNDTNKVEWKPYGAQGGTMEFGNEKLQFATLDAKETSDAGKYTIQEGEESETNYIALGISLGLCMGTAFGATIMDNIGLGMSLGMCFGVAIGSLLSRKKK